MRFREIDKMLKADGWYEIKKVGSHHQYKHPWKPGKVTVPQHGGRDSKRYCSEINMQAGWTIIRLREVADYETCISGSFYAV